MNGLDKIAGVIPAMLTCFDKDGVFDEKAQRALTRFLISRGVDGLYLTGSTGEAFLMDEKSRKEAVEVTLDEVAGQVPVIVHVGDIGTKKSIDYARHAEKCGAAAVSSVPPFYWKFTTNEILSYYADVSSSVTVPMIVYNIALAGLVDFATIKKLAKIDNVKGIKYTATTHNEILRIKDEVGEDFKVYSGADEMALSGFCYGADGIIGSFYNIIPELFIELRKSYLAGDIVNSRLMQKKANAIIYYVLANHFFDTIKATLKWSGVCSSTVLAPFYKLNDEDEERIRRELKELCQKYDITECHVLNNI